jgi:hypothetical protein
MPPLRTHQSTAASAAARPTAEPSAGTALRTFDVVLMTLILAVAGVIALGAAGVF